MTRTSRCSMLVDANQVRPEERSFDQIERLALEATDRVRGTSASSGCALHHRPARPDPGAAITWTGSVRSGSNRKDVRKVLMARDEIVEGALQRGDVEGSGEAHRRAGVVEPALLDELTHRTRVAVVRMKPDARAAWTVARPTASGESARRSCVESPGGRLAIDSVIRSPIAPRGAGQAVDRPPRPDRALTSWWSISSDRRSSGAAIGPVVAAPLEGAALLDEAG